MNTYYVQYLIRNVKPEYLDSYFVSLEKTLRRLSTVEVKHAFIEKGKIYINTYVKEKDAHMAGRTNTNIITGAVFDSLNYKYDEEDGDPIKIQVEKVELVK